MSGAQDALWPVHTIIPLAGWASSRFSFLVSRLLRVACFSPRLWSCPSTGDGPGKGGREEQKETADGTAEAKVLMGSDGLGGHRQDRL